MKDNTRRVVAFVAGRLISGSEAWSIYDCEESRTCRFSGSVDDGAVVILDG
ncbi:MAG: hypothetical protein N2248_05825 [candidate division WOR-3 bacterium]|nr:hypothetical protein [candidate division WOR-3 bacterium]